MEVVWTASNGPEFCSCACGLTRHSRVPLPAPPARRAPKHGAPTRRSTGRRHGQGVQTALLGNERAGRAEESRAQFAGAPGPPQLCRYCAVTHRNRVVGVSLPTIDRVGKIGSTVHICARLYQRKWLSSFDLNPSGFGPCLKERRPADRFASAAEMAQMLDDPSFRFGRRGDAGRPNTSTENVTRACVNRVSLPLFPIPGGPTRRARRAKTTARKLPRRLGPPRAASCAGLLASAEDYERGRFLAVRSWLACGLASLTCPCYL